MKVLVTGGAGYIGSVLIEKLLNLKATFNQDGSPIKYGYKEGGLIVHELNIVDNMVRKQNTLGRFVSDERFRIYNVDILSSENLMEELYAYHDVIIPLAGIVGAPACRKHAYQAWALNHAAVTDMMMDLAMTGKKVIYPCTNSGYGSRPDGTPVTEDDPLTPISTYGKSKVAAEEAVLKYGGVSLRLATVMGYSPCMRLDLLVNDFVWKAKKQGVIVLYEKNFKRNYIHVEDVTDAFIFALKNYDTMKGQAYNLGNTAINMSKAELAENISKWVAKTNIVEAPFMEDPDKRDYIVSNAKIEALGFKCEWGLFKTVQQLSKFYDTITLDSSNVFYENWS
jgi:nucleoside-diphosphate-sugar epimerase